MNLSNHSLFSNICVIKVYLFICISITGYITAVIAIVKDIHINVLNGN